MSQDNWERLEKLMDSKLSAVKKDLEIAFQTLKVDNLEKSSSSSKHEHTAMPDSAKGHKTIDEVANCPDCKPKLKAKFKPELFQEFKQALKNKELVTCDGCGELVERTERECPSCHGTAAH